METLELTEDLIKQFQGGAVTIEEIVAVFNPDNAATMPEAFLQFMPILTPEQIEALAKAYPNKPTGNSYLVLMDTAVKAGQLYPRSTWANLQSLRRVGGTAAKTMVAFTFSLRFNEKKPATLTTGKVQDILPTEVLEGIKVAPVQQVQQNDPSGANEGNVGAAGAIDPAQLPTQGGQAAEGAENENKGGSASDEFEELTIEQIKQAQGNEETGISAAASEPAKALNEGEKASTGSEADAVKEASKKN